MFIPCLLCSDVLPSNLNYWYLMGVDKVFMGIFVCLGFRMLKCNSCNLKFQLGKNVNIDEALGWIQEM